MSAVCVLVIGFGVCVQTYGPLTGRHSVGPQVGLWLRVCVSVFWLEYANGHNQSRTSSNKGGRTETRLEQCIWLIFWLCVSMFLQYDTEMCGIRPWPAEPCHRAGCRSAGVTSHRTETKQTNWCTCWHDGDTTASNDPRWQRQVCLHGV